MLNAVSYLGTAAAGATRPQLFRADDGRVYVVKLQNNRLGAKVLANEFVGNRLGASLGLCFPPGGIILLDERLVKKSRRLAGVPAGRHFACQYLSGTTFVTGYNLVKAVNIKEMAGVMLFDNLMQNLDRTLNRRNLLIRREAKGYRIYAIDNSHLFRRALWTEELLSRLTGRLEVNRHGVYSTLLKYYLKADDFAPCLALVNGWTDDFLTDTVAAIPGEWLPQSEERQAMVRYLVARRDRADEMMACLTALIPEKRRAADGGGAKL